MMASSIEDIVRDSIETQTNCIDDEVLGQKVGELREDLNQLNINNAYLRSGLQTRGEKLLTMEDYQTVLSSRMSEFLDTMSELRKKILDYRKESHRIDQEIGSLRGEKADLAEEEELIVSQCVTPVPGETGGGCLKEADLTEEEKSELKLNDYTRYDLHRKLQCLKELKDTSQALKTSYNQEWSKIKEDIREYREERRQYEMEIQSVHNTALQKMRNLRLNPRNPRNDEDQELLQMIRYLEMKRHNREMRENNQDLEIMSRDIENDISQLLDTKRVLVREMGELKREGRSWDPDEPGLRLHRTSRHTNLLISDDQLSEDTASVGEPEHMGGTHLHRCAKNSCIAIPREMWDGEELKEIQRLTTNMDSEDSTDGSDLTDDVSVDNVNIDIPEDQERMATAADQRKLGVDKLTTRPKQQNQMEINIPKQMDEIATGKGLLTKLRARMGATACSGTLLKPEITSEDVGLRRSSLRDAAVKFMSRRQRRK